MAVFCLCYLIAMNLCVCRFWQAVFRCSFGPNGEHRKPCTTGQRIINSGLTIPNTVALSIRSAQAVATINDYIAENYCDSSLDPSFMVRHLFELCQSSLKWFIMISKSVSGNCSACSRFLFKQLSRHQN